MKKSDILIGLIVIAHSILGAEYMYSEWKNDVISGLFLLSNIFLVTIGIAASIGWLRSQRWAAYLILIFYASQLVYIRTYDLTISVSLGVEAIVSLGVNANNFVTWLPFAEVGVNLFALIMFITVLMRTNKRSWLTNNTENGTPNKSLKNGTPESGAP